MKVCCEMCADAAKLRALGLSANRVLEICEPNRRLWKLPGVCAEAREQQHSRLRLISNVQQAARLTKSTPRPVVA